MTGIPIDKIDNIRKCGIKALLISYALRKKISMFMSFYTKTSSLLLNVTTTINYLCFSLLVTLYTNV